MRLKVAVTLLTASIVTVQVPAPLHAPLQPVKVEVASAVAVSVTEAFSVYSALHVDPQLMPPVLEVTVPPPVPALATVRVFCWIEKAAVTLFDASIVTVHSPLALVHAPPHPVKLEPALGVAVRVTELLLAKASLQSVPQLIPAGLLVTVPAPAPVLVTLRSCVAGASIVVAPVPYTVTLCGLPVALEATER